MVSLEIEHPVHPKVRINGLRDVLLAGSRSQISDRLPKLCDVIGINPLKRSSHGKGLNQPT